MLRSQDRILTTHAGSLPRPPALVDLHGRRSRNEPVDPAELRRQIEAATEASIAGQREAGIDIGNDGEQAREELLHLREPPHDRIRRREPPALDG